MYLVYYGEQVRKDPCSVCADKIGDDVVCFLGSKQKIFHSDGRVEVITDESSRGLQGN